MYTYRVKRNKAYGAKKLLYSSLCLRTFDIDKALPGDMVLNSKWDAIDAHV